MRFPRDFTRIEQIYGNNERGGTGLYPISQSNHWHSGIHINLSPVEAERNTAVYPLIKGELVAYRISEDFKNVQRRRTIPSSDWERLSREEKELYQPPSVRSFRYTLRSDAQGDILNERYTNNFVMLRHHLDIVNISGTERKTERIPFFTLYTNIIMPRASYIRGYVPLDTMELIPLPFYCIYRFRVREGNSIPVYDRAFGTGKRTPRTMTGGDEFELIEPESLISPHQERRNFFLIKGQPGENEPRYINITTANRNSVEVSIINDNAYTFDRAITLGNARKIDTNKILGHAHHPPLYRNAHYDVAVLLNDIEFMRNNSQYEAVERYFFQPAVPLFTHSAANTRLPPEMRHLEGPRALRATGRTVTIGGTNYTELIHQGNQLYFPSGTVGQFKVNMLDWGRFFRRLNGEAQWSRDIDGLTFIRNNFAWNEDGRNVGRTLNDTNANWHRERGDPKTRSIKRSIICGHPLEWDRNLYMENGRLKREVMHSYELSTNKDDRIYFINKLEAVDIWNGGLRGERVFGLNGNKPLTENNFWFAHPVNFINHLDSGGMLDKSFNPYEGHRIERTWEGTTEATTVVVRDNPGFAPKWISHDNAFEGNVFDGYAVPTALFNNLRPTPPFSLGSRHIGVDFRGNSGTAIHSFIYGRVINVGWVNNDNGRILVIANERGKGIYLLAHLHAGTEAHIRRGMRIEPGDVVGFVGRSSSNRQETPVNNPAHLHVEYYDVEYDSALDNGERLQNQYIRVTGTHGTENVLVLQLLLTREGGYRRNPFDHEKQHP